MIETNILLKYFLRRLGTASFVLLGVSLITFFLSHSISSNPLVAWFGKGVAIDPKLAQIYIQKFHLNDPIYVQYFWYIVGIVHGDFGYSPTRGEPVITAIAETWPYTFQLILLSTFFAIIIGIVSGLVAARYVGRLPDKLIRSFAIISFASPAFFVGLAVILVFSLVFPVLPTSGAIGLSITPPPQITQIPFLDAAIIGDWPAFYSLLSHAILPSLANALVVYGILTRVLRSSVLDVLHSNFITAARARGFSERRILYDYAFKNSLVTVITLVALLVTYVLGSTVFIEYIFSYPGLGYYVVQAALYLDYPAIQAITLIFAGLIIAANFLADTLYAVVDPRIRYR